MIARIEQEARRHGGRVRVLPVGRLQDLKADIEHFAQTQVLNGFQRYIVSDLYQFDLPVADFQIRSVIIIASPVPAYAKVGFNWRGERIPALSLARAYPGQEDAPTATKQYLTGLLEPAGYHLQEAPRLPFKRLAVSSGLAVYGRNNICYVEGMGSFLNFVAYFSDVPCTEDDWHEIRQMEGCAGCLACIDHCPTGALSRERFLIDNERCLSYFNEGPGEFPAWLSPSVHHCLYDCLRCQEICPQNNDYIDHVIGPIEFDELETDLLLAGTAMDELPNALREKVVFLGMDQWWGAIPRNLRALFAQR